MVYLLPEHFLVREDENVRVSMFDLKKNKCMLLLSYGYIEDLNVESMF